MYYFIHLIVPHPTDGDGEIEIRYDDQHYFEVVEVFGKPMSNAELDAWCINSEKQIFELIAENEYARHEYIEEMRVHR